jgi:hypothetical protein
MKNAVAAKTRALASFPDSIALHPDYGARSIAQAKQAGPMNA